MCAGPGAPPLPPRPSSLIIDLDIAVDAPRAVFVRGRGLDAELGGALHVGGTDEDPAISGGFDMRNGTINLAGSTLTFTSGRAELQRHRREEEDRSHAGFHRHQHQQRRHLHAAMSAAMPTRR